MGFSLQQEFLKEQSFQPRQIVCLEHETGRLYAEVIQIVESRQICWVRPLVLILEDSNSLNLEEESTHQPCCYDLRSDSDLLYPLALFRAALDAEVIPLLSTLYAAGRDSNCRIASNGHQQLRHFIQKVWQAYPEAF
jgi:hypothetical protein